MVIMDATIGFGCAVVAITDVFNANSFFSVVFVDTRLTTFRIMDLAVGIGYSGSELTRTRILYARITLNVVKFVASLARLHVVNGASGCG